MKRLAYLAIVAILHISVLSGCASTQPNFEGPDGMTKAQYIEMLENRPAEELTDKQIAYLQAYHEERQSDKLHSILLVNTAGLAIFAFMLLSESAARSGQ